MSGIRIQDKNLTTFPFMVRYISQAHASWLKNWVLPVFDLPCTHTPWWRQQCLHQIWHRFLNILVYHSSKSVHPLGSGKQKSVGGKFTPPFTGYVTFLSLTARGLNDYHNRCVFCQVAFPHISETTKRAKFRLAPVDSSLKVTYSKVSSVFS